MILFSRCLTGEKCKYDGGDNLIPIIREMVARGEALSGCPEVLGGLPTPRPPSEIQGGDGRDVLSGKARVINVEGADLTENFLSGSRRFLEIAQKAKATLIVMKSCSPSCGIDCIYDGTFSGTRITGCGVATAMLRQAGMKVINQKTFMEELPAYIRHSAK